MSRCSSFTLLLFLFCACIQHAASAQELGPSGQLTCHKQECPVPSSSCQVLESNKCVRGRCPAILNVADGTSCNDGNICTSGDVCTAGVCGGTPLICTSSTDSCTPGTGCATACGAGGCVVAAAGGYLNPTLTIPAGALSAPVAISMIDGGGDPNDASVFHVYQFKPSGTTFSTPATVDLPAPPLGAGQTVVIEVSDDGTTWTAVATTLNNGRASGPISHFSFCRTRAFTPKGAEALVVLDMVDYQDLSQVKTGGLVIPPAGEQGSCYSGDIFGVCFKIKNTSAAVVTSNCGAPPTATNPPPPGCLQVHVAPWQCYTALRDFPAPFDPLNPGGYEGQHCDNTGLLIPCTDSVFNMDQLAPQLLPANGGLAPGAELWVDLSFFQNSPIPANNVFPYSCFGSSFMGVDLLFREPTGSCAPGAKCDWQAGIRSANVGPFIEVPNGTNIWVPLGTLGCTQTVCQFTCTATTCQARWEWLVNHPANFPALRCTHAGSAIDCSQFQPGDVVIKNWLNDARF